MLHPFGQNKYLSIADDDTEEPSMTVATVPQVIVFNDAAADRLELEEDSEELMLTFEEVLTVESTPDAPSTHPPHHSNSFSPPLPQGPGICPDDYLLYKGRWIHKQTICCLVINKDFVSKSHN
jgi:hypothetical protein